MDSKKSVKAVLAALAVTSLFTSVNTIYAADQSQDKAKDKNAENAVKGQANQDSLYNMVALLDGTKTKSTATTNAPVATTAANVKADAPKEDTQTDAQKSVTNSQGFYVQQDTTNGGTAGVYNSLTKDGLWVGGTSDDTGFHVDNARNAKTTGTVDATDLKLDGKSFKDAGLVPGTVDRAPGSIALGDDASVSSDTNEMPAFYHWGVAIGDSASVKNSSEGVAIGAKGKVANSNNAVLVGGSNSITDSNAGVVVGSVSHVKNSNSGVALGNMSYVENSNFSTALGSQAHVLGTEGSEEDTGYGTAVGFQAVVNQAKNSVALGAGSSASSQDLTDKDDHGVVSVGSSSDTGNGVFQRRVINVADGVNKFDAVNKGQLDTLSNNAVQYDKNEDGTTNYDSVTFKGKDGTVLNNVKDIALPAYKGHNSTFVGSGLVNGVVYDTTSDNQRTENGSEATSSIAIGRGSNVRGTSSLAVGIGATVGTGDNSTVIANGTALGSNAKAGGQNSTAVGEEAEVAGDNGAAFGYQAKAEADSTAIGTNATAGYNGDGEAVAIGKSANVQYKQGVALGNNTEIMADQGTALGYNAKVTWNGKNSVALGAGSIANDENVVSVGREAGEGGNISNPAITRRIINVKDGTIAKDSHDAVTGGQLFTTNEKLDKTYYIADANAKLIGNGVLENHAFNLTDGINLNTRAIEKETKARTDADTVFTDKFTAYEKAGIKAGHAEGATDDTWSLALGEGSSIVDGDGNARSYSVAVGVGANIQKDNSTAVGTNANNNGNFSTSVGEEATGAGDYATALGGLAYAYDNGTAVGTRALAQANSVALGANSIANDKGVVSVGHAKGDEYTDDDGMTQNYESDLNRKIVNVADGTDDHDVATYGQVKGAIGLVGRNSNDDTNLAVGKDSYTAAYYDQTAGKFGNSNNTALGVKANISTSSSQNSTAVGNNARIDNGTNATAIGQNSSVGTDNGTAIGQGATVAFEAGNQGSVALGQNSAVAWGDHKAADTNGVVSVGKTGAFQRRIINVADGVNDTDAATVGQVKAADKDLTDKLTAYENAGIIAGKASNNKNSGNYKIALGVGSVTEAEKGTALGAGAKVLQGASESVALGYGSVAGYGDVSKDGQLTDPRGVISVGKSGKDGFTRRIINVKDGVNDTDAATVGQMNVADQKVKDSVTSTFDNKFKDLQNSLKVSGNDSAANALALGDLKTSGITAGTVDGNGSVAISGKNSNGTAKAQISGDGIYGAVAVGPNTRIDWTGKDGWGMIAIGDGATVKQSFMGALVGAKSTLDNSKYAVGFGDNLTIRDSYAGTSIGNTANIINSTGGTALGATTKVLGADRAVALGSGSVAVENDTISVGRSAEDIKKYNAYVDQYNKEMEQQHPGDGNYKLDKLADGDIMYRRLTNVAAGKNDNDAVTVGQFKGTNGNFLDAVDDFDWKSVADNSEKFKKLASAVADGKFDNLLKASSTFDVSKISALSLAKDVPTSILKEQTDTTAADTADKRNPDGSGSTGGWNTTGNETTTNGNVTVNGKLSANGGLDVGTTDKNADLNVHGSATVDKTLNVKGDLMVGEGNKAINVGKTLQDNQAAIKQNQKDIASLGTSVQNLGDEVDSVGAISAALAGLHPLDYGGKDSKFQISAALGSYDGTRAAALGGFYNANRDTLISFGVSTNLNGDARKTAANIGATFRVGQGNSKEIPDDVASLRDEVVSLKAENATYKDRMDEMEKQLQELLKASKKN